MSPNLLRERLKRKYGGPSHLLNLDCSGGNERASLEGKPLGVEGCDYEGVLRSLKMSLHLKALEIPQPCRVLGWGEAKAFGIFFLTQLSL